MTTTKMGTIVMDNGLRATADLETAVRFAIRTGLPCRSEDQIHVAGAFRSPYARIVASQMEADASYVAECAETWTRLVGDRGLDADGPATRRMAPRAA